MEQTSTGGRAYDLNIVNRSFPLMDFSTSDSITSVKTYDVLAKGPTTDALTRYRRDFFEFFDAERLKKAAGQFDKHRTRTQAGGGWLVQLPANAGRPVTERFLSDHGKMSVLNDHVVSVRARIGLELYERLTTSPAAFGLPNLSQADLARFVTRQLLTRAVLSGMTSSDVRTLLSAAHYFSTFIEDLPGGGILRLLDSSRMNFGIGGAHEHNSSGSFWSLADSSRAIFRK